MNEEQYICVCGKSFQTKKSLGHHKTHCKCFQQQKKEKQLEQLKTRQLPNGMFKCENCGKEITEKFGSGRFCSLSCSRSFIAKQRHKAGKLKKHLAEMHKTNRKKCGWKCAYCNQVFETRAFLQEHKHLVHKVVPKRGAWNKGHTKETDDRIAKYANTMHERYESGQIVQHVSVETRKKISDAIKKSIKEGRSKGWQLRNIESYAEKFWKMVLDNNNIEYKFNYPIKKSTLGLTEGTYYFLDFALLSSKIDLEIDGSQHLLDERRQSDICRDKLLIKNGWKVYRIPWNKLRSESDKEKMKKKVDEFLEWYKQNK